MLQDIAPHTFHNEMSFAPPSPEDYALICDGKALLCKKQGDSLILPRISQCTEGNWIFAFSIDDSRYYLPLDGQTAPGFPWESQLREGTDRQQTYACFVGLSLARWYKANRFCGCCGKPMVPSQRERAMVCPECGHTVYPKICPAVIVAICHGDKLLLTQYARRSFKRYALVAGYCEIGETVEQCVRREVMEETGLRLGKLRFYKSQPWVVTDSLLMGFFAQLEGEDLVTLQEDELSEGAWFSRDELPEDHSTDSLTGEMIEVFRQGLEPEF